MMRKQHAKIIIQGQQQRERTLKQTEAGRLLSDYWVESTLPEISSQGAAGNQHLVAWQNYKKDK
jgi:hypothetical protein